MTAISKRGDTLTDIFGSWSYVIRQASARSIFCIALLLAGTGCAGWSAHREGNQRIAGGDIEGGLAKLSEATRVDPDNLEYRRALVTQRESAVSTAIQDGARALEQVQFEIATQAYERALRIEPRNSRALAGLERVQLGARHAARLAEAETSARNGDFARAQDIAAAIVRENPADRRAQNLARAWAAQARLSTGQTEGTYPKLRAAYRKPVSLAFRDATLTQVFESLKLASGINFMFDKDVRTDTRLTIGMTNKTLEDVIRVVLAGQRLSSRTLDEDTLLIYPNTPEKARDYQELMVRTFYLGNADATKLLTLARNVLKVRDVYVDEKLNVLVMRDTSEVIRLAEKVIANIDIAEPEVMLELEVLEISFTRLRELGIHLPDSISASVTGASGAGSLTYSEMRGRSTGLISFALNNPLLGINLKQSDGDVTVLSNPRIRIRNRQTARVLVGERVPVITTTVTANVGTSESVSYLDVGLKLELEPTVSLDDEVSMRVALEVSSITGTVTRSSGLQAFRIGTRNASTLLRVKDGETQILAGLIQREDRRATNGVPYLSDLPMLGRLFSDTQKTDSKTEVVLLITPRVVRNISVPGMERLEIPSGTEAAQGAAPIQLGAPTYPGALPVAPVPSATTLPPPQQPSSNVPASPQPALQAPANPNTSVQPLPAFQAPTLIPSAPGSGPGTAANPSR